MDMLLNDCGRSRCPVGATIGKLAVMLVVTAVASVALVAPKKDKDQNQEFTRIYQHTYDEVFQASLEAIERLGCFVTAKDKDKGTISGNGKSDWDVVHTVTFDIHIEALSTKPETRVTMNDKVEKPGFLYNRSLTEKHFEETFTSEVQKVLATYH